MSIKTAKRPKWRSHRGRCGGGRGFWDVEKHKESIAFWHLAGLGLWASGHIHFGDDHLCPSMDLYPSKTYEFHSFLWFRATLQGVRTRAERLQLHCFLWMFLKHFPWDLSVRDVLADCPSECSLGNVRQELSFRICLRNFLNHFP